MPNGFQDRRFKPLSHLSVGDIITSFRPRPAKPTKLKPPRAAGATRAVGRNRLVTGEPAAGTRGPQFPPPATASMPEKCARTRQMRARTRRFQPRPKTMSAAGSRAHAHAASSASGAWGPTKPSMPAGSAASPGSPRALTPRAPAPRARCSRAQSAPLPRPYGRAATRSRPSG